MNEFFKLLADETRLRCLVLLATHQELCVCELSYALQLPQSKISRHLSIMRLHKIILQRRVEQWIFYSMNPVLPQWQTQIIQLCVNETKNQLEQDNQRLQDMENRPYCRVVEGNCV